MVILTNIRVHIHSLAHLFTHSPNDRLSQSVTLSLTHSPCHSFFHLPTRPLPSHSSSRSLPYSPSHSLTHSSSPSLILSLTHSLSLSLARLLSLSLTQPLAHLLSLARQHLVSYPAVIRGISHAEKMPLNGTVSLPLALALWHCPFGTGFILYCDTVLFHPMALWDCSLLWYRGTHCPFGIGFIPYSFSLWHCGIVPLTL